MIRFLALVLLCFGLTACAERREPGADAGVRIVSLSPAATVMLNDLGLGPSIVGRHGFDQISEPSLPVVGDQTGIDYERLIRARPTHIVIEWGARDAPERLMRLAADRAMEVIPFETLTLADIAASAARLAEVFADRLDPAVAASLIGSIENLSRPVEPRPECGRVLLAVSTSPTVDCLGPGSAHHEILVAAGYVPALPEGAPWMTLSLEDVITLDPHTIVLVQPAGEAGDGLGPLSETGIAAVRLGRVVRMTDPQALIPSSNLVGFADTLRDRLRALGPLPSPRE